MYFTDDETNRIKELTDQLEKNTGVELVVSVVGRCDNYPEVPWKAFSLCVAISALVILVQSFFRPEWLTPFRLLLNSVVVLGSGAVAALLTTFWPGFARLFLDKTRAEGETEQYAGSIFLEREIFNTNGRVGILILVGLFERQVVILPDSGVKDRLDQGKLKDVIDRITGNLRKGDRFKALTQGITTLETGLKETGFAGKPGAPDQIPDEFSQERGADK